MATCTVRITRRIIESKIIEVELAGNTNDEIDNALADYMTPKVEQNLLDEPSAKWDLEDAMIEEYEVEEYNFDEEDE